MYDNIHYKLKKKKEKKKNWGSFSIIGKYCVPFKLYHRRKNKDMENIHVSQNKSQIIK